MDMNVEEYALNFHIRKRIYECMYVFMCLCMCMHVCCMLHACMYVYAHTFNIQRLRKDADLWCVIAAASDIAKTDIVLGLTFDESDKNVTAYSM